MELNQAKKLGVFMDNSVAKLMEYSTDTIESLSIESKFTHEVMEESLEKSESIMHNKKRQQQAEYLKDIASAIRNYEEVLIFGPTEAKIKLAHKMKGDQKFSKIKIHLKQTDYMTENQQHAFVRDFYANNLI
ncbi:MAG: hypothetical protein V4683_07950 [Bacteroidota bacterium]